MKKSILFLSAFLVFISTQFPAGAQSRLQGTVVVAPDRILESIMTLLMYKRDHLRFSEDFTGYDIGGKQIHKREFLKLLGTGSYLPLALTPKAGKRMYQLHKLPANTEKDFRSVIRQWGETYLDQFSWEGQMLPSLNFVDINGERYTPENTRGKILVLKCWFISCLPCVQEMPRLNQIVEHYRKRKDILFVSLAIDPKDKLVEFLEKTKFSYAVVPGKGAYMSKELRISGYPTHLVINREGKISKMVSEVEELVVALNEESNKK